MHVLVLWEEAGLPDGREEQRRLHTGRNQPPQNVRARAHVNICSHGHGSGPVAAVDILLKNMILFFFFFFLSQIALKTADRQWAVGSGQAAETCSVLLFLFIYTGVQEQRPSSKLSVGLQRVWGKIFFFFLRKSEA